MRFWKFILTLLPFLPCSCQTDISCRYQSIRIILSKKQPNPLLLKTFSRSKAPLWSRRCFKWQSVLLASLVFFFASLDRWLLLLQSLWWAWHSSTWVQNTQVKVDSSVQFITAINTSATVKLLEQRPEKNFRLALSGIRTHDLCDASAVLSQLSYQSHMRAVVCGLALYMWTLYLAQV